MTNSGDWSRVRECFERALELPCEERAAFLDASLGGECSERAEVERLLAAEAQVGEFLEPPPEHALGAPGDGGWVGRRVGPYRILRLLATGGMGVVLEAEQESPRRRVALKTIRPGTASPPALRRFQDEIELLARLRHPGIAQIFEAGFLFEEGSVGGVPWYAMELIEEARPLTEYARREGLDLDARLALFLQACDAVHHGHQRGVIHRDLKPSNLLVDGTGQVKVIDFGIARTVGAGDGESARLTRAGELVGTLLYMSPEQLSGEPLDLDLRSDVYSLGVLLYELLADRQPHELEGRPLPEACRILVEEEPEPLHSVRPELSRELDWIARRALAKEPSARYDSALELARDLRRYLALEPVLAGPPSRRYRLRKFARRHRVSCIAAGLVALALLVGFAGMTAGLLRAQSAEEEARLEREQALDQARRAESVIDFLLDLFSSPDPARLGREVKMVDALDRASSDFDRRLSDVPAVRAWFARVIARAYRGLGQSAEAGELLHRSEILHREHFGDEHPETARLLTDLGDFEMSQGRLEEAGALLDRALNILRENPGPDAPATLRAEVRRGALLRFRGEREAAREVVARALGRLRATRGERHRETLAAINLLAGIHHELGALERAEPLYREALEGLLQFRGADHPQTLAVRNNIALLRFSRGERDGVVEALEQVLEDRRRVLGLAHDHTIGTVNNLAAVLSRTGQNDAAIALFETWHARIVEELDPTHELVHTFKLNLGHTLHNVGRSERGARLLREALELRRQLLPMGHEGTLRALSAYACVLIETGEPAAALSLLEEGWRVAQEVHPYGHPGGYRCRYGMGRALRALDREEESAAAFEECRAMYATAVSLSSVKDDLPKVGD